MCLDPHLFPHDLLFPRRRMVRETACAISLFFAAVSVFDALHTSFKLGGRRPIACLPPLLVAFFYLFSFLLLLRSLFYFWGGICFVVFCMLGGLGAPKQEA